MVETMSEVIQIKEVENLSLMDAIQMQTNAQVLLKARGRMGLPHKVIRIEQNCSYTDKDNLTISLNAGDIIAAYRVASSEHVSGNFYFVRLREKDLKTIDSILVRRFDSSLAKEQASNVLPNVRDLPYFTVSKNVFAGIALKAKELYTSDGTGSTRLTSIVQLNENLSFLVFDTMDFTKRHLYQAHKGDIFCILKNDGARDETFRLVLTAREDVPAIKMQEKKEKILGKRKDKKTSTQKVLRILRKRKIEKTRN